MDKQKIIIIVLSVALILTAQYIVLEKWLVSVKQDMVTSYQDGYDAGAKDVLTTIYLQTKNCQTSTITLENSTLQVFDINCLQTDLEKINP